MQENPEERYPQSEEEKSFATAGDQNLSQGQKIAVAVLAFFAVLVFSFWVIQARSNLRSPFVINEPIDDNQEECIGEECNIEDSRNKDTDGDGLSDYDEIHIYGTSPYLEDTDSDGFTDYEEVMSGNDPNCPFGQVCHTEPAFIADDDVDPLLGIGTSPQTEMLKEIDPATIRQMLLDNGMDSEVLNQFSDEELMSSFQELVNTEQ